MPALLANDTIAAIASAAGPAARGIVRCTGSDALAVIGRVVEFDSDADLAALRTPASLPGRVALPEVPVPLPVDVCLWPTPRSFTGQPAAELHACGSPPLLEALLGAVCAHGARPARRGEFTFRAFLAGKLDLLQAEAVLGTIEARDRAELDVALAQLAGGLSGRMERMSSDLLDLLADLEAGLDFVDEDIAFVGRDEVLARLSAARDGLARLADQSRARSRAAGCPRVVLAGLPNAGKSTLFNALAGRSAALVSDVPGTTRDWLSAEIAAGDAIVELVDTAGWEPTADPIARAAQESRHDRLREADLVLWCRPAGLAALQRALDAESAARARDVAASFLVVGTMCDRAPHDDPAALPVSAVTGEGLDELRLAIAARPAHAPGEADSLFAGGSGARCGDSLDQALRAMDAALDAVRSGAGDEIVACEVRSVLDALGRVLGTVDVEDVLDRVFDRFCIGK